MTAVPGEEYQVEVDTRGMINIARFALYWTYMATMDDAGVITLRPVTDTIRRTSPPAPVSRKRGQRAAAETLPIEADPDEDSGRLL